MIFYVSFMILQLHYYLGDIQEVCNAVGSGRVSDYPKKVLKRCTVHAVNLRKEKHTI